MFIISEGLCNKLFQENPFLRNYFNEKIFQELLNEGFSLINSRNNSHNNIIINNIEGIAQLFIKNFVQQPEEKPIPFSKSTLTNIYLLFKRLLEECVYNSKHQKSILNPIIIGSTYITMKSFIERILNENIEGSVNLYVSNRPFCEEDQCESIVISEIIAGKNSLTSTQLKDLHTIIEEHCKILYQLPEQERIVARIDMYFHIIDFIKNTSYRFMLSNIMQKANKENRESLNFREQREVKDIIYKNISCLATEKDMTNFLVKEYNLKIDHRVIISSGEYSNEFMSFGPCNFTIFKKDRAYQENKQYTIISSYFTSLTWAIEYERCMKKTAYFLIIEEDNRAFINPHVLFDLADIIQKIALFVKEEKINKNIEAQAIISPAVIGVKISDLKTNKGLSPTYTASPINESKEEREAEKEKTRPKEENKFFTFSTALQ